MIKICDNCKINEANEELVCICEKVLCNECSDKNTSVYTGSKCCDKCANETMEAVALSHASFEITNWANVPKFDYEECKALAEGKTLDKSKILKEKNNDFEFEVPKTNYWFPVEGMEDTKSHVFVLESMKKEMLELIKIAKEDYQTDEAKAIRDELIELIKKDSLLETFDIEYIIRVDSMIFRSYLFEYKGRGYVLGDAGNTNYSYVCTAEEALVGIHYTQFSVEY